MSQQGQPPAPGWPPATDGGETVAASPGALPAPYAPDATVSDSAAAPGAGQLARGRLGRAAALDLLGRLKATVVVGSLVAFAVFLALAATHATGVTARGATSGADGGPGAQATARPGDDGGFFNGGQHGGFGVGEPGLRGPASGTAVS